MNAGVVVCLKVMRHIPLKNRIEWLMDHWCDALGGMLWFVVRSVVMRHTWKIWMGERIVRSKGNEGMEEHIPYYILV